MSLSLQPTVIEAPPRRGLPERSTPGARTGDGREQQQVREAQIGEQAPRGHRTPQVCDLVVIERRVDPRQLRQAGHWSSGARCL